MQPNPDEVLQRGILNPLNLFVANQDDEVSPVQLHLLNQSSRKVKETVSKIATEHKELHGGISKIGKAVDRVRTLLQTV